MMAAFVFSAVLISVKEMGPADLSSTTGVSSTSLKIGRITASKASTEPAASALSIKENVFSFPAALRLSSDSILISLSGFLVENVSPASGGWFQPMMIAGEEKLRLFTLSLEKFSKLLILTSAVLV